MKLESEIMRIPTSVKAGFAIALMPNAWFSNPRHQDSNPKNVGKEKKGNLETSMNKYMFAAQDTQKTFKMGSLNLLPIYENQSLDLKASFAVLPNVPRSWVPGRQSEATKHAE